MAAPEVAIRRLATRIRAAAPEDAFAARSLLDQALRRMDPGLDVALERAGLSRDTVVALPRLHLRLHLEGDVSAAELGEAWGNALAKAIISAMPPARSAAPAQEADDIDRPVLFRSLWDAEMAVLRAIARGEPVPWWTMDLFGEAPKEPEALLAEILARWIARDPVRAARRMTALLGTSPALAARLEAGPARMLALRLLEATQAALHALAPQAAAPPDRWTWPRPPALAGETEAAARLLALLPASLRGTLAAMTPAQRQPWLAAALLSYAPAEAVHLATLLREAAAQAITPAKPAPGDTLDPGEQPQAEAPEPEALEVWCGGLLLLVRPLARLRPAWLSIGAGLHERLVGLGLIALQRLAAPLPHAARRAALERDRPLLAIFAGAAPPDGPLDEVRLPPSLAAEAEDALAALLAALPPGIEHAPGALRRAYGRDPFSGEAATDALCRLLLRPGRLVQEEAASTLVWPLDAADIALRRAGWDTDPGWVPWVGRRIAFRYGA